MDDAEFGRYGGEESELAPREPSVEDLVHLCRNLNSSGCRYLVVGGFAIIGAGYNRRTMDIDFLVDEVAIPFASPRLLWRMKARTHRAKDEPDLVFLREYFKARGEQPPQV